MKKITILLFLIFTSISFCNAQANYKQSIKSDYDKHISSDTAKWAYLDEVAKSTAALSGKYDASTVVYTTDSFKMVFSTLNAIDGTVYQDTYTFVLDRDIILRESHMFSEGGESGNFSIAFSTWGTTISSGADLVGGASYDNWNLSQVSTNNKTLPRGTKINIFVRGTPVTIKNLLYQLVYWWKLW